MRFVRAWVRPETGEIVSVVERETPFPESTPGRVHTEMIEGIPRPIEFEMHELGMAADFVPTSVNGGTPCSPARHIHERLEFAPHAEHGDVTHTSLASFRAKEGHQPDLPEFIDVPTTVSGLARRHVTQKLHPVCRAWLTLMLPPDEVKRMGYHEGIPLGVLKSLDDMRMRRDPQVASLGFVLRRYAQKKSDKVSSAQHRQRNRKGKR